MYALHTRVAEGRKMPIIIFNGGCIARSVDDTLQQLHRPGLAHQPLQLRPAPPPSPVSGWGGRGALARP